MGRCGVSVSRDVRKCGYMSGRCRGQGLFFCFLLQISLRAVNISTNSDGGEKTLMYVISTGFYCVSVLMVLEYMEILQKSHMVSPVTEVTFILYTNKHIIWEFAADWYP